MFSLRSTVVFLVAISTLVTAKLQVHNSSFVPDRILRVTEENVTQGCVNRLSVLVNGELVLLAS